MELLIVVVILAVLVLLAWIGVPKYLSQARDAKRESDIAQLRVVLEDYYNDAKKYPPATVFTQSGIDPAALRPYLLKIPTDPKTKKPYIYVVTPNQNEYTLYADLENGKQKTASSNPNYAGKVVSVGSFLNYPIQTCRPDGCDQGNFCPKGMRCDGNGLLCYEDSTCPQN